MARHEIKEVQAITAAARLAGTGFLELEKEANGVHAAEQARRARRIEIVISRDGCEALIQHGDFAIQFKD